MEGKSSVFRFEGIEVHDREFSFTKGGEAIAVEPKAFRVLLILLRKPQKLVSKEELMSAVWGDTAVTENSLTRAIALLRRLLADDAREPRFIETVTGVGYRFVCPIEVAEEPSSMQTDPAGRNAPRGASDETRSEREAAGRETSSSERRHGLKWAWAGAAIGAVIILGTAWYLTRTPAPPYVASYTQVTFGGRRMGVDLTDGSRLYLNSDSPNTPFEVAVSGGQVVPLKMTVPGSALFLDDISPDGTQLLVVSSPADSERYGLWLQSIPGGTTRHLADARFGSFSPDGKSIVYTSLKGDEVYSVNSDGTGVRRMASLGRVVLEPRWAPDARHLRFEKDGKLWEMSPDGTGLHLLLPDWAEPGEQSSGRWSLDGRYYFFLSGGLGGQIWGLDEKSRYPWQPRKQPFQLTSEPLRWGRPVPGRDGQTIFATGETVAGELSRFDERTHLFAPFLNGVSAEFASFSRDGKFVAYASFPEGGLWKTNRDGSGRTQLASPPIYAANPQWSPDGSKIVFSDIRDFDRPVGYIVSSEGGESPRRLVPEGSGLASDPGWSADGKKVVFAAQSSPGNEDIRILDLTADRVTVLPGSQGLYSPRWSPDGKTIAALSRVGPFLRLFDVTAQAWRKMNTTDLVAFPCFSRDSRTIYFLRYGNRQGIIRIQVPDGVEEEVADLGEIHLAGIVGTSMSLDPTDAPLVTRRTGTDDVYALKLSR